MDPIVGSHSDTSSVPSAQVWSKPASYNTRKPLSQNLLRSPGLVRQSLESLQCYSKVVKNACALPLLHLNRQILNLNLTDGTRCGNSSLPTTAGLRVRTGARRARRGGASPLGCAARGAAQGDDAFPRNQQLQVGRRRSSRPYPLHGRSGAPPAAPRSLSAARMSRGGGEGGCVGSALSDNSDLRSLVT